MACEIPQYVVVFLEEPSVIMGAGVCSDKQESQAENLKKFEGDVELLVLSPLVSFRNAYECTDGSREANGRANQYNRPRAVQPEAGGLAG